MHSCTSLELFPFQLESKISDLLFFLFCLTKQLRYATYGLENCCSCLGSIKHTYISMVKQTIPHRRWCNLFSFFFLLSGAQYRILNNNNKY